MKKVKLYSLNMSMPEFLTVIYFSTGIQLKYFAKTGISQFDFDSLLLTSIKDIEFEIEGIFEQEDNFIDTLFTKRVSFLKSRHDYPIVWLKFFRDNKVNIAFKIQKYHLQILERVSPPLHEFVINSNHILV